MTLAIQLINDQRVYDAVIGWSYLRTKFDMPLSRLCSINIKCVWRLLLEENVYSVTARVIYDLRLVKSKRAEISVLSVLDLDCMIDYLYVNYVCFNFGKMSITPDWIRYLHQILWEDASRPCGDDYVSNIRHRKLIRVTSSDELLKHKCIEPSTSVTITDIWTKFGTEHKYHAINQGCLTWL